MADKNIVFVGIIASSSSLDQLDINSGYIAVQDGKVTINYNYLSHINNLD